MAENSASIHPSTPRTMRSNFSRNAAGDALKRLLDLVASAAGLLLLSPLFLFLAWRIKRDSPGPVFFRGLRVGRGGIVFKILKFRTMHEEPESYTGPRVTAKGDPRITPFGQWLRDSKLNELPQLWNVLKGDMSLVGPRPEDPDIAADWPAEVSAEVLSVRPGITSPASVIYRDEEQMLKGDQLMATYVNKIMPSKLRLDQLYVRNRSFLLDLDILFWTFMVLFPALGQSSPPEESLFLGPISRFIRRYVSWFVIDMLVTFFAMGLAGLLWRSAGPLDIGWPKAMIITLGFSLLYSMTGAFLGVNRVSWSKATFNDAFDILPAAGLATMIALTINYFWLTHPLLPSGLVLLASGLATIGFILIRYRSRLIGALASRWLLWRGQARAVRERVLIVGGGEAGQFAAFIVSANSGRHLYQVVGYVDDDLYKQGMRIRGVDVIGRREDIPHLVKNFDVGVIIFAIHNITPAERRRLVEICLATPARLVWMPDLLGAIDLSRPNGHHKEDVLFIPARQHRLEIERILDELQVAAEVDGAQIVLERITLARSGLRSVTERITESEALVPADENTAPVQ